MLSVVMRNAIVLNVIMLSVVGLLKDLVNVPCFRLSVNIFKDKHSSLVCLTVSDKKDKFYQIDT
jgi:hypothetical protein